MFGCTIFLVLPFALPTATYIHQLIVKSTRPKRVQKLKSKSKRKDFLNSYPENANLSVAIESFLAVFSLIILLLPRFPTSCGIMSFVCGFHAREMCDRCLHVRYQQLYMQILYSMAWLNNKVGTFKEAAIHWEGK